MAIMPTAARFTLDDPRIMPEPNTGCWLWSGCLNAAGYGWASVKEDGCSRLAHRQVWFRFRGPIAEGMVLDHMCRVRSCVNPDHLRVVTRAVNNVQNSNSVTARQAAKPHCPKCGNAYTQMVSPYTGRLQRKCPPCDRERSRLNMRRYRQDPATRAKMNAKSNECHRRKTAEKRAQKLLTAMGYQWAVTAAAPVAGERAP